MGISCKKFLPAGLAGAGFLAFGLATAPAMADGSVTVRDFVLSHGVEAREPVGETATFGAGDERAYAFARIENSGAPTTVRFVWHYEGATHAAIPVEIGRSPGWRTWSSARLRPGAWRVELIDDSGAVLKETAFTVGPKETGPVAMQEAPMQGDAGGMGAR